MDKESRMNRWLEKKGRHKMFFSASRIDKGEEKDSGDESENEGVMDDEVRKIKILQIR